MVTSEIQQVKLKFGIIGNSEGLNRAIDIAIQVAPTDLSVLITGESGVGKEHFPKIIHQNSSRKHGQYIAVNCGAIPEGTIDSELFGHEKGAFTGAIGERKGYFGEANGGTIFLDEVGELPLSTQARLLRVLETGEFIKVGSSKVEKTNVRIVAATNVNLTQAIVDGRFREDLYYRLNTVPIKIPPLRERQEDIYLLFRKFASDFAENYQLKVDKTQRYIYFRMEVNNNTAQPIELYHRRFGIDWFDPEYNDEQVRKAFYTWEKDNGEDGTLPTYPNANKVVQVPTTLWAYNNGTNLNSSSFGIVCYTGTAGQPRQENTYGSIPTGLSYLDCIGQITENMQTFRLVYRTAGKEVNFVLRPSDLG